MKNRARICLILTLIAIVNLSGCKQNKEPITNGVIISAGDNKVDTNKKNELKEAIGDDKVLDKDNTDSIVDDTHVEDTVQNTIEEVKLEDDFEGMYVSIAGDVITLDYSGKVSLYLAESNETLSGTYESDKKTSIKCLFTDRTEVQVDEFGEEQYIPLDDLEVEYKIDTIDLTKGKAVINLKMDNETVTEFKRNEDIKVLTDEELESMNSETEVPVEDSEEYFTTESETVYVEEINIGD